MIVFDLPDDCVWFTLTEEASKKHPFPCPCSYRTALSHYVDIQTPPRTHVLRELAEYATNPEEKEFLIKISQATEEGKVRPYGVTHLSYWLG